MELTFGTDWTGVLLYRNESIGERFFFLTKKDEAVMVKEQNRQKESKIRPA